MPLFTPPTKTKREFFLDEPAAKGLYETDYGYNYDITQDPEVPNVGSYGMAENQKKLDAVYGQIEGVYADLIKSGRQQQAFALRDAADKFRRVGAKYGVNSFQRIRAMKDLEGTMNVAAQAAEGRLNQQKLADLRGTLSQMAGMSTQMFGQAMQRADFRERKLASLRGAEKTMPAFRSTKTATRPRFDTASAMRSKASANSGIPPWMQEAFDRNQKLQGLRGYFQTQATGNGLLTGGSSPSGVQQSPETNALLAYYGGGQTGVARSSERPTYGGVTSIPGARAGGSPVTGGSTPAASSIGHYTGPASRSPVPAVGAGQGVFSDIRTSSGSGGITYASPTSIGQYVTDPLTGKKKLTMFGRTG